MQYRTPGVYIDEESKIESIRLHQDCIVGFIGIAERGPFNKPVRITNFSQFRKIFGNFVPYGYLPYSVYGFFNSGGKECVVVRVAHFDANDAENSAKKAVILLNDVNRKPVFEIEALSEGVWGNNIQVKIEHVYSDSFLVKNISEENDRIDVDDISGYFEGEVLSILNNGKRDFRKIKSIEGKSIFLNSKIKQSEDNKIYCEKISLNFHFINGNEVESYQLLSQNPKYVDYYVRIINSKSNLIKINNDAPKNIPGEIFYSYLSGGKNGILSMTPGDFIGYYKGLDDYKGLGILESILDISLIVSPDILSFEEFIHTERKAALDDIFTVQRAIIDQCEKIGNRFCILDSPSVKDIPELLKWRERFDSKHAAIYFPKIEVFDPNDERGITTIMLPPSGHIAGIYASCDEEEGIFRPPANKFIKGAVSALYNINNQEYEIIYPKGINCLKNVPGRGVKVWGARTLSSDTEWIHINVARTFAGIKNAIRDGSGWAVFEPNNGALRKKLVRHVSAFLLDLWHKGYLVGTIPEQGFYVLCNDELNPPEDINAGIITVEIGIAVVRPAEFLVIRIKKTSDNTLNVLD
jgi:uncharacterized protein